MENNLKSNVPKAKMMPHSIEAEQSVLGACLIDNEAANSIMSSLNTNDFYLESHQEIFEAMTNIFNRSQPIDYVTVTDELDNSSLLQSIGGLEYITSLTNILPSAANFKTYVEIVKKDSMLRQIISAGQKVIENAYESSDATDAINFAEKTIFEIAKNEQTSSLEHISGALNDVINKFDMLSKNKGTVHGIRTGFKDFDAVTNGLQNSDLILLAARPGVGKTSFAMNIITHAAIKEKKKCAIFNLEMPRIQIAQRAVCSVASVSMAKALKGELSIDEWKSIWTANKQLAESNIYIDDSSMNTPMSILSKCRKLQREQGLDLLMIDYLQLMSDDKKSDNRQGEVAQMTRNLKIAAKELNIPIILLSQLSRASELRKGDHKPQLSDLRESGSIEQDADIVLFIYKPDMYNDVVNEDEPGVCTLSIAKHRNGEIKDVKLRWIGEYTTFVDKDKKPFIKRDEQESIKVVDDNAYGEIPPEQDVNFNIDELKDMFKPEQE